jgi:large subunit ribosomal protein L33
MVLPLCKQAFLSCSAPSERKGTNALPEGGTHYPAPQGDRDKSRLQEVPISMANEVRVKVTLVCSECKQRNYDTKKNKKNDPDRIELKKYCRFCRKHTTHKESK